MKMKNQSLGGPVAVVMAAMSMVLLLLLLGSTPDIVEADECSDMINGLMPCASSVMGSSPPPPSDQCCTSVKKVSPLTMCKCLKSGSFSFSSFVNQDAAKKIPQECGLVTDLPSC